LTRTRKRAFVPVDVNQLILQVTDLHGEEMAKKQIVFEDHLDRSLPGIHGDPEKLYRAFSNLLINALQAMPGGGRLSVSSKVEKSDPTIVEIAFRDTGIGMDEITAKNIFNPFYTTKDKGVGLGMALAHKIMEDHRGSIEVTSEKGKGALVVLRIPVVKT
jgi:signal transduction histidine kinase